LQLRIAAHRRRGVAGTERFPTEKEEKMRIVESLTAGVVAVAAQLLVVATVFI